MLLAGVVTTLGASLLALRQDASTAAGLATTVSWLASWLVLARFRFFGRRRRWPLVVALILIWSLALGGTGWAFTAMLLGLPFMLGQQHGLRRLGSRQRALLFLLALLVFGASFGGGLGRPEGQAGDLVLVARVGVQAFWLSTILTLLFNMRLHFLRLRAKLAVAGVLVGVVPMLLLAVFALVLLYGSLGGARANGVGVVLDDWAREFARGVAPIDIATAPSSWQETGTDDTAWQANLVRAWRTERRRDLEPGAAAADSLARAPLDTTTYLRHGADIWLARVRDPVDGPARVDALRLDDAAFDALARRLRADVFLLNEAMRDDWEDDAPADSLDRERPALEGHWRPDDDDEPQTAWTRPRVFGAALVEAPRLVGRRLHADEQVFVGLRTSLDDLAHEFASRDNPFTTGVMVGLGVVALLLMFTGLVALIFSSRITGGITGAVRELHRGTRRLAAGDLDTVIRVDNEDEFGDLATSFNEMTTAVKQGREDALARERLQQEMQTARRIQERLLPHDQPLLAGWDVTGVSIPSLQVGGDYFDFVAPGPERLGVAIGDVSGKGVPAALLMSNLQASLKGQVLHPAPVSDTVARINDLLAESTDSNMFATFLYGELEAATGRFTCTSAGHDPALVVRRDGTIEWLGSGGLILGMLAGQHYDQMTVDLEEGDVLVLYTDGITEAGAPTPAELAELADGEELEDRQFGEQRLAEVVAAARERPALGIREAVLEAVQTHLRDRPQGDDITLVVIRRGEPLAPPHEA